MRPMNLARSGQVGDVMEDVGVGFGGLRRCHSVNILSTMPKCQGFIRGISDGMILVSAGHTLVSALQRKAYRVERNGLVLHNRRSEGARMSVGCVPWCWLCTIGGMIDGIVRTRTSGQTSRTVNARRHSETHRPPPAPPLTVRSLVAVGLPPGKVGHKRHADRA